MKASPTGTPGSSHHPQSVNASTLNGKVIFGYQGWFSCPGDGSQTDGYVHWTDYKTELKPSTVTIDNWPDTSDLTPTERCSTSMKLPSGKSAPVFSSYNPRTVDRHFAWMETAGIDGVAAQRFVAGLDDPRFFDFRNTVLKNIRAAAEKHGRVFYVEYDVSGLDPAIVLPRLEADWTYLVDNLAIVDSPNYLHDHGRPVVEIFGLGLQPSAGTAMQARDVVRYFKSRAEPRYRATVIGGLPSYWRTGTRDAFPGTAWAAVYRSFDVISPWAVGRYGTNSEADTYRREVIAPDLRATASSGRRYMPVIFPGFSWANLHNGPSNEIPRVCGRFFWHQAFNAVEAGSKMMFVAMFDEVDEGTAMFKLARNKAQLPVGAQFVALNADGCSLPSDWYLQLGGAATRMLRGKIRLTPTIPIARG